MKYSKNGTVFYTSTKTPIYPLLVDAALYTQGATLNSVISTAPSGSRPSGRLARRLAHQVAAPSASLRRRAPCSRRWPYASPSRWHSLASCGRSVEAQSGTAIQVDVAANRRPIDPRVYGVNWADAAQLAALNVPVHRWGGNSTTRHNWKTNGDNRGSDWYFESIPGSGAPGRRVRRLRPASPSRTAPSPW